MRLLILLLCLSLSSVALGQVYRWVDKDGNVHFSDVPQEGAEELDLPDVQTFEGGGVVESRPAPQQEQTAKETRDYVLLQITRPALDQTFWNVGGQIPVSLNLEPALQRGDSIRVYLDDQPVEDFPSTGTSHVLSEVWRGSHTLRAEVVNASGQVLAQSEMVVFQVRQTSVVN